MSWCGRTGEVPHERPSIVLLLDSALDTSIPEIVGKGCEEEGIPLVWETAQVTGGEAAHGASLRSRLDVGIAVKGNRAFIGIAQFPDRAWMEIEVEFPSDWRWVGQVAARVVKGQPLPPKPGRKSAEEFGTRAGTPPLENAHKPSPLPMPAAELLPISPPCLERCGDDPHENSGESNEDPHFEALVRLVTQKIVELLNQRKR